MAMVFALIGWPLAISSSQRLGRVHDQRNKLGLARPSIFASRAGRDTGEITRSELSDCHLANPQQI
jgi:hypothetical protein